MRKNINRYSCEGILYEANLEVKTCGERSKTPGAEYLTGSIKVATDEEITNIVEITFSFVQEKFPSGKVNSSYAHLTSMMNGTMKPYLELIGDEQPTYIRVDGAIELNDFYTDQNGTLKEPELVSARRIRGSFIHPIRVNELNPNPDMRNRFNVDVVITNTVFAEANPERNLPDRITVKAAAFDFTNKILPMDFTMVDPDAVAHFTSSPIVPSDPMYINVTGTVVSKSGVKRVEVQNVWGGSAVEERPDKYKDYIITTTANEAYAFGEEGILTAEELKSAIAERNVYLATRKQDFETYRTQKVSNSKPATNIPASAGSGDEFNF